MEQEFLGAKFSKTAIPHKLFIKKTTMHSRSHRVLRREVHWRHPELVLLPLCQWEAEVEEEEGGGGEHRLRR